MGIAVGRNALAIALVLVATPLMAVQLRAGPNDYREAVRKLRPGDTLTLDGGTYRLGLDVHGLTGTDAQPIAIVGAAGTRRTVFLAQHGRNTVSIKDAAYVRIADLDLVGRNAAVDAVKAEGTSRYAHDVTIEGLRIEGYAASQQNVAISTKCPAWNWTIRNNRIARVGTGLYLGDSDGSAPFVRGVIEGNVITGTRGYSMQIKHQNAWPDVVAADDSPGRTIIRYNTFVKDRGSSTGELARPNVLLGHWPLHGRGATDRYLVYGNLVLDNPTEYLLQAEGNVVVYNNVLINRSGDGVAIREHHDVPREVRMFHNTILATGVGMLLRRADPAARQVVGCNVVFAASVAPVELANGNIVHGFDQAAAWLRDVSPGTSIDLAPREVLAVDSRAEDVASGLPDADLDFGRKLRRTGSCGAFDAGAPGMVRIESP